MYTYAHISPPKPRPFAYLLHAAETLWRERDALIESGSVDRDLLEQYAQAAEWLETLYGQQLAADPFAWERRQRVRLARALCADLRAVFGDDVARIMVGETTRLYPEISAAWLREIEGLIGTELTPGEYFSTLHRLAEQLPTGLRDPRAVAKMQRERVELAEHAAQNDRVGAILEAADVCYYAAKAVANGLLSYSDAVDAVLEAADAAGVDWSVAAMAATEKYYLRARPGNLRDDAAERAAVERLLSRWRMTKTRREP